MTLKAITRSIPLRIALLATIALATIIYLLLLSKHVAQPGMLGNVKPPWGWRTGEILRIDKLKTYYILLTTISLISIVLTVVITLKLFKRNSGRITIGILSLITVIGFFLYLTVTLFAKYEFHIIPGTIVNRYIFGLFEDAIKFNNIFDIISGYEQNNGQLVGHSVTHPPGNILLIKIIILIFERSQFLRESIFAICKLLQIDRVYLGSVDAILRNDSYFAASTFLGLLLPLLSIMSSFPLYILGKSLFNRRVGYLAALLSTCIPAYILISPQIDQLYVLLAVSIAAVYVVGYRKANRFLIVLAGLTLTISLFFTLAMILLIPIILVLTVVIEVQNSRQRGFFKLLRHSLDKQFILFALSAFFGFFAIIALQPDLLKTFSGILKHNSEFNKTAFGGGRPYLYWLVANLYEYFMFLGISLSLVFLFQFFEKRRTNLIDQARLYAVLILIVLIVLDLAGINRGEVSRLWMFLMPFFLLSCATYIDKISSASPGFVKYLLIMVIVMQFLQSIAFRIYMPIYNVLVLVYS